MIHQKLKKIISLAPRNIEDVKKINNFILSKDPFEYFTLIKAIKYYNEKKYDSALVEFKKIETSLKNNAYLKFKIGMCYFKKGNWVNAIDYFEKAKKNKGYNQKWDIQYNAAKKNYRTKKINVNILKSEYDLDKDNIEKLYRYANALKSNASYWVAIHEINNFKLKNNLDTKTKFLLSRCYEKLTNHEKAIEVLLDILGDEPDNPNYQYSMGFNLDCMGSNEAKKYYENFIFLRSYNQKDLHLVIGDINSKRGFWDKAVESYCKYEGENNKISNYEFYLKRASAYMKTFEWAKAISDYLNALNIMQYQTSEVLFECATCYEKNFDYYSASTFYKKAIRKANTFNSEWYYRCALMLEKIGKKDEALQFYQQMQQHQNLYIANKVFDTNEKKKRALYTAYYEELSIDDTDVLIESFLGNNCSCNPLAILKKMLNDKKFLGFNFYIVLNEFNNFPKDLIDDRIILVKRESDLYLRMISSAKYLINNVSFPYYFIRKEGQFYLNTWHGTPLKTLGKDIKSPLFDHANVSRNFLQATHIISQNNYTNEILLDKYDIRNLYSGKIAETGYPRVDFTLNISEKRKKNIIEQLGLDGSKPIVLYAPTWRGTSESKSFDIKKLITDLTILESQDYDLVFKCHHFAEKIIRQSNVNVKLVDPTIDVNELLGCVDLLISDYSSIAFDFINTRKPIISYCYDFDEYVKTRGLYVDSSELIGLVVDNIYDLKETIKENLGCKEFEYSDYELKLVKSDDGNSTQRVIDFFFYNDSSFEYKYDRKPVHLMYTGPYLPNGILKSFTNLVENLKNKSDDDFCIVFNRQDVLAHSNRKDEFLKNYREDISYFSRVGAILVTLEEAWVREKYENNFEKYSQDFMNTYIKIYKREVRRLFGDTEFKSVVNFEGYSLFWSALLSQIKSPNKIIFQHNDLYSEWKSKYPYLKGVFNLYDQYSKIISVSEMTMFNNMENLAKKFNLSTDKFEFANNTILPEVIRQKSLDDTNINPEFSEYDGRKILNIGRLSHEKDQEKLIRAFSQSDLVYQDVKLFILGQGSLYDHLNNLIIELNLVDKIYLLGQVDNPYCYLKQADLFVLSSNHEGQPMVLLEALTLGTPILATDIIGNRSILKDMNNVLCENNLEALKYSMTLKLNTSNINKSEFNIDIYNKEAINKICSILGC